MVMVGRKQLAEDLCNIDDEHGDKRKKANTASTHFNSVLVPSSSKYSPKRESNQNSTKKNDSVIELSNSKVSNAQIVGNNALSIAGANANKKLNGWAY